ncbi:mannonate dehydratase [Roseivivax sediminis]|uniref:Mannonate dehydratase n=1 Tax=Roseivivax sediminis TaxID=936889 RepID=A0A1I2C2A2_9RHOB|nr:mannonate dehydratase [Roseivivax sediminis]SFE62292.1 D-mannonate dehydratase [Roseivivax sediminis]
MQESWRWFGPKDPVTIDDVRQTGARGIVTALHHIAPGAVWSPEEIARRQREVAGPAGTPTDLTWSVVESLPVSEDIKRQSGAWREHVAAWVQSLHHIAAAGIEVVCYNFMPVLDWTRTDLDWAVPGGATCMRFDLVDFAAFDLHVLERPGAEYAEDVTEAAARRAAAMTDADRVALTRNVVFGLPGAAEEMSLTDVRAHLDLYRDLGEERLRRNLIDFLEMVAPEAERLGLRLCCHPDDPPFPLLGLPRIMSTEADYASVLEAVDVPANGVTLCSGSLGARADNDLPGMMARLGDRVHFLHLRNVRRDSDARPCSFYESGHLDGDVDMVALLAAIRAEEGSRRAAGRADHSIPFRPDHGLHMVDDRRRQGQPGYPLVGRHVGLAELRGAIAGLDFAYA